MAEEQSKKGNHSKGSLTAGFILVGVGLVFLLSNLNVIPDLGETWPLFLIIIGASLVLGALRDRRSSDTQDPNPPTEPTPPPPIL
ncbi:MAG TPA: DUF5668 domain-containing protein [bacterium]|nr:DUF5668 domain-containing protein [bacterium]